MSRTGDAAVRDLATPLTGAEALDPILDSVKDARLVLIGEASHGTSGFYAWRAALTERLVAEKGFDFVSVEGDWPDCDAINRFVKDTAGAPESARDALAAFQRWPTWMWANADVLSFTEWLRGWNDGRGREHKVGFYGLDVYSLYDSLSEIVRYLSRQGEAEALDAARRAFTCFQPYGPDDGGQGYARATTRLVPESCADEVVQLLGTIRRRMHTFDEDPEGPFSAEQNALVARNAERYYRDMVRGGGASWNTRDRHMMETLDRLMDLHGDDAHGVVWAHNTHVGDARFTDMAGAGMINIGELAREEYGEDDVVLVGFTTHRGSVVAGRAWDAPWERMDVPPAKPGSHDAALHDALGGQDAVLTWDADAARADAVGGALADVRGQRAIGVVYDARSESYGNYVPTRLLRRYDALIHLDETRALDPLPVPPTWDREPPETYPSGL